MGQNEFTIILLLQKVTSYNNTLLFIIYIIYYTKTKYDLTNTLCHTYYLAVDYRETENDAFLQKNKGNSEIFELIRDGV